MITQIKPLSSTVLGGEFVTVAMRSSFNVMQNLNPILHFGESLCHCVIWIFSLFLITLFTLSVFSL